MKTRTKIIILSSFIVMTGCNSIGTTISNLFSGCSNMFTGCSRKEENGIKEISNEEAMTITQEEENQRVPRRIVIVNKTGYILNKLVIYIDSVDLYHLDYKNGDNLDKDSFSYTFEEGYDQYTSVSVAITDRYGEVFRVEDFEVKKEGTTTIPITKDDLDPETSDTWTNITKFFNGD